MVRAKASGRIFSHSLGGTSNVRTYVHVEGSMIQTVGNKYDFPRTPALALAPNSLLIEGEHCSSSESRVFLKT